MSDLHNFHYVYTTKLDDKLCCFVQHENFSKSAGVDFILSTMKFFYQRRLILLADECSHYLRISADLEIWAEISEVNYRWIKQIHDMTNTFSMAQVVRFCLESFFSVAEKLGSYAAACEYFLHEAQDFRKKVVKLNLTFKNRLKKHMCIENNKIIPQIFIISQNYHLLDMKLKE